MSLKLTAQCLACHLQRNVDAARALGDEAAATTFARDLLRLYLDAPEDATVPSLDPSTTALFQKHYGLDPDRFRQEKTDSNRYVLARMEQIKRRVSCAPDPLLAALQFSILGNYIDFSALAGEVSFDTLDSLLEDALEMTLDEDCYAALRADLEKGKSLLLLTDNAGEIGFDRVLAETLQAAYPHLAITFCVRGAPAKNDATREDAEIVGIPFPVIDNGTAIAGTDLARIGKQARDAIESADVILSKGQGNVETLLGCGYNIYYAFLVKCPRFIRHFGKPKLTPMLVKERK